MCLLQSFCTFPSSLLPQSTSTLNHHLRVDIFQHLELPLLAAASLLPSPSLSSKIAQHLNHHVCQHGVNRLSNLSTHQGQSSHPGECYREQCEASIMLGEYLFGKAPHLDVTCTGAAKDFTFWTDAFLVHLQSSNLSLTSLHASQI